MSRTSVPLVLAIAFLSVLPVHLIATAGGLGHAAIVPSQSVPGTMLGPNLGLDSNGPDFGITSGTAPRAFYPSDGYRTASAIGPAPLLRSAIDRHNFPVAWAQGYRGQGVNIAVVDQGVDFGHPDLNASYAVEGNATSPYYQWPLAFDPKSMAAYLKTGLTDGTWYANTSVTGRGPFEITHTIKVDGTNDFGESERLGTDPRDNSAGSPGGNKADFDLTDLYATRDSSRWYFGFSAYLRASNDTYVLLLDLDNETGGTTTTPGGKFADTNTSATDIVTDVAFSPNGLLIATVSADRYLRVWDRTGRILFAAQAHAAKPSSVAWSPDGTMVATADPNVLIVWDAATGRVLRQVQYVPLADTPIDENAVLGWSPNSTWIGAGTARYVHIINALTGQRVGALWATNSQVNAVRFNRLGTQIATALGDGTVAVFTLNATNIQTYPPVTRAFTAFTLTGGHSQAVLDVSWSSDDSRIISGGRDNNVVLWDVASRSPIVPPSSVSGGWVTGVEWRKDGAGFVSVSAGLFPTTPPRLIYWTNAGAPALTVPLMGALNGVDTSIVGDIGTASSDLSARLYSLTGGLNRILVAHKPDAAIVVDGWSRYSDRDQSLTHGLDIATFYRWNTSSSRWEGTGLFAPSVNGTQASFQFGERLFNEISIPRALLGDPAGISVEMFSAGRGPTKPQDTVPSDPNVFFKDLDFGPGSLSLGAFAYLRPGVYTVSPAITSTSGVFHFGYHPSPILTRLYGAVGLLVVDPTVAGRYDEVYVDLNNDHRFDATDVKLDRNRPVASLDNLDSTGAPGRDGIPDVSGGIMYFIANGVDPLPYSDRYVQLQLPAQPSLVNRIPASGTLVAFLGEFGLDPVTGAKSDHGTRLASLIVGRGLLNPPAIGVAPAAKLVALGNALDDVVSSWYFAVEGYDGRPGTGDEAQVVLNPFNFPTLPNDGSDQYSRTADFLSMIYTGGRAIFVAPAGDYGFGYGSIASPASAPAVLAVARVEDGTALSSGEGGPEGPNPHYLDLAMPSARGPTSIGTPKPDLVAIGTAIVDIPLQSAPGDGTTAVTTSPMTGTDVAAAIAAGAAALVWQAAGSGVGADRITEFLRSGATDLSYDALVQGSGFLDVAESVRLATGAGGVLASPATLVAGAYRGVRAEAYPRMIAPGASNTLTLRLENRGGTSAPVAISDAAYALLGTYSFTNATVRDAYSPNGDIVFWLNASGVSKVDGTTLAVSQVLPPIPGAWGSADLLKVTATSDFSRLVWNQGITYVMNYTYTLGAMDWVVNASNWAGRPSGPYPAPALFPNELNTISKTNHQANVLEVRVREPAISVRDGLVVRLGESISGSGLASLPWKFTVEMYRRVDWAWVSTSAASISIPARGTTSIGVSITVPANAGLGTYEGLVLVTNTSSGRSAAVPVIVNVGGSGPDLRIGGDLLSTELYDNSRLFGGYDLSLRNNRIVRPYMGDWRFYFVDIPDAGMFVNPRGLKLLIDLKWNAKPSDLDIQVFGRATADAFSTDHADRYGPAPVAQRAKTEELDKPDFKTATNLSEDILVLDLRPGLNVIAIHAARLKGDAPAERADGKGGWVRVRSSVDVSTPRLAGRAPFTFLSSLDLPRGLRASAVGPATTTSLQDEPIPQDWQSWWNFPNFGEFLYRGSFTHTFTLQKALILQVHLQGKADVSDLDLGVFRDVNDNGVLDPEEVKDANSRNRGGNDWQYDADSDADETVKWIAPADGRYFVKVLGFTVNAAPGHFDLDISITLDTGKGYEIPQAPKPAEIVQGTEAGLPPLRSVDFSMAWDFPGETTDGDYGGAVLLGLPDAPGVLVIPVSVGLDRLPPEFSGFSVSTVHGRLNDADNRTTTDPSPILLWSVADPIRGELDATRVSLTLDGTDVTSDASISITLRANAKGVQGFWDGTVKYTPKALSQHVHDVTLTIGDIAGNLASESTTVVVDTTAPSIAIEGPAVRYTRSNLATITVISRPGAFVNLGGAWVPVDGAGRLTTTVTLLPGANEFRATAAFWFDHNRQTGEPVPGNANDAKITIVQDSRAPTFRRAPGSDEPLTRADGAVIQGTLADEIAPGVAGSTATLALTVAGGRTEVHTDGTFTAVVPLMEGDNVIEVRAVDLAGNEAFAWANVTRDTVAPLLSVDPIPSSVTEGRVGVSGRADPGSLVTVNGFVVPLQGDRFSRNVSLSGGDNLVVVRAEDGAGNAVESRFAVTFAAGERSPVLGIGLVIAVIVVALIVAFLIARRFLFPPAAGAGREDIPKVEGPEVQAAPARPEDASPREVEENRAPEPSEAPRTDAGSRLEEPELQKYDEALKDLDSFEREAVSTPPPEDPRIAKVREAYEAGKISREAYEANLKRLEKGP